MMMGYGRGRRGFERSEKFEKSEGLKGLKRWPVTGCPFVRVYLRVGLSMDGVRLK